MCHSHDSCMHNYLLMTTTWQIFIPSLISPKWFPSPQLLWNCILCQVVTSRRKVLLRVSCQWKDSASGIWFASFVLTPIKHHLFQFLIFLNQLFGMVTALLFIFQQRTSLPSVESIRSHLALSAFSLLFALISVLLLQCMNGWIYFKPQGILHIVSTNIFPECHVLSLLLCGSKICIEFPLPIKQNPN